MAWALRAAEEVVGRKGLAIILRDNRLVWPMLLTRYGYCRDIIDKADLLITSGPVACRSSFLAKFGNVAQVLDTPKGGFDPGTARFVIGHVVLCFVEDVRVVR